MVQPPPPAEATSPASHTSHTGALPVAPQHLWVLGSLALAAVALSLADEVAVFRWFNHAPFLPGLAWQWLSVLGLGVSVVIVLQVLAQRRPSVGGPHMLAALLMSFLTVGLPIHLIKWLAERPRPVAVLPPEWIEVLGRPLTHGAMPSGHSGTALAVMAVVLLAATGPGRAWRVQIPTVLFALGVLWSRMACGAHWPWDVIAGATLGWLGGAAAVYWAARSGFARWCGSARAQPWLHLLLLVASVSSALDNIGYPDALLLQWGLAALGSGVALWRLVSWYRDRPASKVTA